MNCNPNPRLYVCGPDQSLVEVTPSIKWDLMVTGIRLTDRALEAAIELKRGNQEFQHCVLRLYIDGKGCDGFYYGVTFTSTEKDDISVLDHPLAVVIDKKSLEFMAGSTVDWVDDTRGKGFLVSNPNHSKFRGKFYKRQSWQKKLSSSSQSLT